MKIRPPHPGTPAALWLVEDEPSYRDALAFLVTHITGLALERTFGSAEEVLAAAEQAGAAVAGAEGMRPPDVVLMDVNLPGADGISATALLRMRLPDTRVVVLTVRDDADTIFAALRAGASGYLPKGSPVDTLVMAIQQALDGGMLVPPTVARRVLAFFQGMTPEERPALPEDYGLSVREREVLAQMTRGLTQKEIADVLTISPSTISGHVQHIYEKLRVHTVNAAVAKAVREGLV